MVIALNNYELRITEFFITFYITFLIFPIKLKNRTDYTDPPVADTDKNTDMKELNDITYLIRGAAYKVHDNLGPGLLESIYDGKKNRFVNKF